MKITVGCSMKYRDLAIETVHNIEKLGHTVLFPNLTHVDTDGDNTLTPEVMKRFAIEHYAAIDEADAVYFIVPNGIMGTSLKLELGTLSPKTKRFTFRSLHTISRSTFMQKILFRSERLESFRKCYVVFDFL